MCLYVGSSDTNHIENTEVSNFGLGRRPDMRTISLNVHSFKLFNVDDKKEKEKEMLHQNSTKSS